ncbi:MAG: BlaI/MecI/CopY family transcriptional regulator [Verrucomicrobiota bacterium]
MPPAKNPAPDETPLSRRERQLMDIIYRRTSATARDIHGELPDAPSYSTVRTLLTLLVKKGQLTCETSGRSLLYRPARQRKAAAASALRRLVRTFFEGSVANAVSGLLSLRDQSLTPEEIARLEKLITENKQEPKPE